VAAEHECCPCAGEDHPPHGCTLDDVPELLLRADRRRERDNDVLPTLRASVRSHLRSAEADAEETMTILAVLAVLAMLVECIAVLMLLWTARL
jgi:hypothetical protein